MFFFFEFKMKLKALKIENFKSIQNTEVFFDEKLSVLTGSNNCGKTTIIEAIAFWVECFEKLASRAKKSVRGRYNAGDYILGPSTNRYFEFGEINSVRAPHFEDIFINRNIKKIIRLTATVISEDRRTELKIPISIRSSTKSRYAIKLENEASFKYRTFNTMFQNWRPTPVSEVYASPIASIIPSESFLTTPQLQEKINKRESEQILRNRLYKLYHSPSAGFFQKFERDVSYILYNTATDSKIHFFCKSDINRDKTVVFNFKLEGESVEKDISLLGSGSLQIIEILLNLYNFVDERRDLVLILLDEPDSHIHRDMQRRLIDILKRTTPTTQIVVTTHNESLIRSTQLTNLFHVDVNMGIIRNVESKELSKIGIPHFTGLYPDAITPIVRSVCGGFSGLDFISALEADKIVFVEGDDDARLLYCLFRKKFENSSKKIMFWVLGGVSKVLDKVDGYYQVFKDIKNGTSLWDKSVLVFDQDALLDEHKITIIDKLQSVYKIKAFAPNLYTQESVLLTDSEKLFPIFCAVYGVDPSLKMDFVAAYEKYVRIVTKKKKEAYSFKEMNDSVIKMYQGMYIDKMNLRFGTKLKKEPLALAKSMSSYYLSQPVYKLAKKEDVAFVIDGILSDLGSSRKYTDTDLYSFAQKAENSTLFDEWNRIVEFLG